MDLCFSQEPLEAIERADGAGASLALPGWALSWKQAFTGLPVEALPVPLDPLLASLREAARSASLHDRD